MRRNQPSPPRASSSRARVARATWWLGGSLISAAAMAIAHGCGSSADRGGFAPPPDASTAQDAPSNPPIVTEPPFEEAGSNGPFTDFPPPILDVSDAGPSAPPNAETLFTNAPTSDASAGGGPCLLEPDIGSLYPKNWLRPRFRWIPAAGETLFELRAHVPNQTRDLVVYTTASSWTMPKAIWDALRQHSNDLPITIAIRGGAFASGALADVRSGSSGEIGIAPVDAPGTIVYWTTTGVSQLKGFSVGDEAVSNVLLPSQVQMRGPGNVQCVGCHASTPDGKSVGFGVGPNGYTNALAVIEPDAGVGSVPPFVSAAAVASLNALQGIPTFSKGHWAAGDHTVILSHTGTLTWVNLEATGAGMVEGPIARTGDPGKAVAPTWSHDGATIAYDSTTGGVYDGRPGTGPSDIYVVPYNNRAGGVATKLAGASEPGVDEYYPAYAPDDALLVYNRVAQGVDEYNAPTAEVFVTATTNGAPTRLSANDPPQCSGKKSPGVTNSWPKFSPEVATAKGQTYYWVVFSTTRDGFLRDGKVMPQLYIAPIVVDAAGKMTTYRALYLWNQPFDEANHTPAWDVFKIPPPAGPR